MSKNYINPLPGVPNVESPFFDEMFLPGNEYFDIARSLHIDGFAVLDFPDDEFETVADQVRSDLGGFFDLSEWQVKGGGLRIQDFWKQSDSVRRIATNEVIIRILSQLYGRPAFPFQTLNFPVGTEQHFHTDSVHFSSLPERFMCGVWVAFEDIGPDQGPLLYYPGSHRWPIYRNEHIGHVHKSGDDVHQMTFEPLWERLVEIHNVEPARFYPRKGQALIWASNLLHGGDAHRDRTRTRWSQVTHYFFENCVYQTPLASNEMVGDLYVRDPFDIVSGQFVQSRFDGAPFAPVAYDERNRPPFDPAGYLRCNPDVAQAGADPYAHFVHHGAREGRRWYDG